MVRQLTYSRMRKCVKYKQRGLVIRVCEPYGAHTDSSEHRDNFSMPVLPFNEGLYSLINIFWRFFP